MDINKNKKMASTGANKPVKQLTPQQVAQKRERNRRRRASRSAKSIMKLNSYSQPTLYSPGPMMQSAPSVDTAIRAATRRIKGSLTEQGASFLKCAFAPPDFASNNVGGVPDEFAGLSLVKRHKFVGNLTSLSTASTDTYVILAPVPGIAYYYLATSAGAALTSTSSFAAVPYADFTTLFSGSSTASDVVNEFRFMSNHIEIIPTVNQMQWTGSIQVMRCKISIVSRANSATTGAEANSILSVSGLNAVTNFGIGQQYTGPFFNGMYTGAYCSSPTFNFSQIIENQSAMPNVLYASDWGQLNNGSIAFPGLDNNFDSILIKFSGMGTNVNNSALIKTWACVEYKVVTGALLYEYQTMSPTDEYAIKLYREIIKNLPIAVTYMENEGFWTRVLSIIKRASGSLAMLPGPYGGIAGGVHMITTGIESLL